MDSTRGACRKASTPLSTPTAGCRIKPRSGSLLSSISPSCSQPVGSRRSEDQRRNGRTLSQTKFGWTGRQSIAMLRRETIFEDDEEENKVEKSDDSFDEDELLSQVASRVEQKFIATQKTHSEDTDAHSRPSQSVPGSNGRCVTLFWFKYVDICMQYVVEYQTNVHNMRTGFIFFGFSVVKQNTTFNTEYRQNWPVWSGHGNSKRILTTDAKKETF